MNDVLYEIELRQSMARLPMKPLDQMKCTNCADTGVILNPPGSEPFAEVCKYCNSQNNNRVSS